MIVIGIGMAIVGAEKGSESLAGVAVSGNNALQAPVSRVFPAARAVASGGRDGSARGSPAADEALTAAASLGHGRQRGVSHNAPPALALLGIDWYCGVEDLVRRPVGGILIGQAELAPGADGGNGINCAGDFGLDGMQNSIEREVGRGRQ